MPLSFSKARSLNPMWKLNGGNFIEAVKVAAALGMPGAVLSIESHLAPNEALGASHVDELIGRAWQSVTASVPPDTVGARTLWARFDFFLEGSAATVAAIGIRVAEALQADCELRSFPWEIVLVELFTGDPDRTLMADAGYSLRPRRGSTFVAWVRPYGEADWRESQRYPTTTFLWPENS